VKTEKKNTGTIAFRFRQVLLYFVNCVAVPEVGTRELEAAQTVAAACP
jgi:hypothetical protein